MSAVTVVITAHNEAGAIRQTLTDLGAQDPDLKVLVIDDRSTDATWAEAEAARLSGLTLLPSGADPSAPLTPRQQALDTGIRAATGDIIVTLDADSRPDPGWLRALTGPILSGGADAAAGPVAFSGPGFLPRWQSCDAAYYLTICRWLSALGLGGAAMFGNFAFRAGLYDRVGGFDRLGPALTEDFAFSRAIASRGARIAYPDRSALITVKGVASFRALVDRTLRVTSAPPSALGLVLALWPLSLLMCAIGALLWPGAALALALRYAAGVALTGHAVLRNGRARDLVAAPLYEPFVFVLAVAALWARAGGRRITWGGRSHG